MLKYGHIQQLNHVSFRPRIAKALQMDSDDCYKELMGNLADGEELAKHEFTLRDLHPPGPYSRESRKKGQQRMRREEARANCFICVEWADRDLDMGSCGHVQAVISCFNDV
ncbi:unnamed protein product [Zymoseptoria tritici ST99CH_1E4]|uniref:Uncharacterized protein n=1 Tax=Zymoseptoria tritici ST99CH_1E4 TaxID=1276532 RepID=A0A2H1FXC3_ZYMTR|nr:unnamed protein product [Zymoseptoria tritici ST99CH_1E4]